MTIEPEALDRIKQAAATALVAELLEHHLAPGDVQAIGDKVLDAIDRAAADELPAGVFAPGRRVNSLRADTPELSGTITRVVENRGEVHTVYVQWDGWAAAEPESPRVLELAP